MIGNLSSISSISSLGNIAIAGKGAIKPVTDGMTVTEVWTDTVTDYFAL
jgi:hypothetical protein